MLESLSAQSTLQINEESRFIALVIDGGYNQFYSQYPDLCSGGYIKETDDTVNGPRCRGEYEAELEYACAMRALSQSYPEMLFLMRKGLVPALERRRRLAVSALSPGSTSDPVMWKLKTMTIATVILRKLRDHLIHSISVMKMNLISLCVGLRRKGSFDLTSSLMFIISVTIFTASSS